MTELTRQLAHDLVRLEAAAREFERLGYEVRAQQTWARRESVREQRSTVLREIWRDRRLVNA